MLERLEGEAALGWASLAIKVAVGRRVGGRGRCDGDGGDNCSAEWHSDKVYEELEGEREAESVEELEGARLALTAIGNAAGAAEWRLDPEYVSFGTSKPRVDIFINYQELQFPEIETFVSSTSISVKHSDRAIRSPDSRAEQWTDTS